MPVMWTKLPRFNAERTATEAALTAAGRPNCRWTLARVDEFTLGAFLQMLEFQTAFAGELYGVDAFDQPGVEQGKKMTYGLMGRKGYEEFAKGLRKQSPWAVRLSAFPRSANIFP